MSETLSIGEKSYVTFYTGPKGEQWIEITVSTVQAQMPLSQFCKDMLPISELAAQRCTLKNPSL